MKPAGGEAKGESCRLYLVTPPALDPAAFAPRLAEALDAGDVAAVQLRLKEATEAQWREAVAMLQPVAQAHGAAFLLNDRPELAAELGCDGAHVGQDDMPAQEARRLLGPDRQLGVTCHDSRDLAMRAGEDGADYVAFGAFHPTATKDASARADPALLAWWSEMIELPCVAIGGITAANCAPLVQAGADFLAVVGAVWADPDGPGAGVRVLEEAIHAASRSR